MTGRAIFTNPQLPVTATEGATHGTHQPALGHRRDGLDDRRPDSAAGMGNWFLIPFAAVGAIIAAIGVLFTAPGNRGRAKTGLVLNGLVIVVAVGRLVLGGGIV